MKTALLFLSIALPTLCGSCGFDLFPDPKEPKTELEKLPPITQTGKNTFGYLVNGEAIVAGNTSLIAAVYQGGILSLGGG